MKLRFDSHLSIGPVVMYGCNAMHFAIEVHTRWGYFVARPTTWHFGRWWRWYAYLSPNGTPDKRTWGVGPGLRE